MIAEFKAAGMKILTSVIQIPLSWKASREEIDESWKNMSEKYIKYKEKISQEDK